MKSGAHLQAIEGDEVDLDAEAWAPDFIPARPRGSTGNQQFIADSPL